VDPECERSRRRNWMSDDPQPDEAARWQVAQGRRLVRFMRERGVADSSVDEIRNADLAEILDEDGKIRPEPSDLQYAEFLDLAMERDEAPRAITEEGQPLDAMTDAEMLVRYRTTFDDDGADDELVLDLMGAWRDGLSLGPFIHGIPLRT
jgi:hypothetical protein